MSDTLIVFAAIEDFVKSLEDTFPSKDKKNPLHLYSKMIDIIKKEQDETLKNASYEKAISGFKKYFTSVKTGEKNIFYGTSSTVYLPLSKFLKSDSATREVIQSHLSNIRTMLKISETPSENRVEGMSAVFKDALGEDADTEDGQALQRVAEKIGTVFQEENMDPMSAIGALMADNSLEELMNMFNGKKNNKLVRKLFNSILDKALPDETPQPLQIEAPSNSTVIGIERIERIERSESSENQNYEDSTKAEAGSD